MAEVPFRVTFTRKDEKGTEFSIILSYELTESDWVSSIMSAYSKSKSYLQRSMGNAFDRITKIEPDYT